MDFATQVAQRENADQILSGAAKALWSAVSRPDFYVLPRDMALQAALIFERLNDVDRMDEALFVAGHLEQRIAERRT